MNRKGFLLTPTALAGLATSAMAQQPGEDRHGKHGDAGGLTGDPARLKVGRHVTAVGGRVAGTSRIPGAFPCCSWILKFTAAKLYRWGRVPVGAQLGRGFGGLADGLRPRHRISTRS